MNIYNQLLREFWFDVTNGKSYRKRGGRGLKKAHKLRVLKEYSHYYHGAGSNLQADRNKFNFLKHETRSIRITEVSECFGCGGAAECRHHIILLKNGGTNGKQNIVHLCNECHAEIHPWLKKYLPAR